MKRARVERLESSVQNVIQATQGVITMCIKYSKDALSQMAENYKLLTGDQLDVSTLTLNTKDNFIIGTEETAYIYCIDLRLYYGPFGDEYPVHRMDLWPWTRRNTNAPEICQDVAVLVSAYLTPGDVANCTCVSKNWKSAFSIDRCWERFKMYALKTIPGIEHKTKQTIFEWFRTTFPMKLPKQWGGAYCLSWLKKPANSRMVEIILRANFPTIVTTVTLYQKATEEYAWRAIVKFAKGVVPELEIRVKRNKVQFTAKWGHHLASMYGNINRAVSLKELFDPYLFAVRGKYHSSDFVLWQYYQQIK